MGKLVIVRHGESAWNLENRFTGDVDVDLTPAGESEAHRAGLLLREYAFNIAYTSVLKRAIRTLDIILNENIHPVVPIVKDAALNERRYGDLQGLNKKETAEKFGEAQVLQWRRSYYIVPPGGESLKNTYDRVIPYFHSRIEPGLIAGQTILVVAHGNSLRALMMLLEAIAPEEIVNLNLATGAPREYQFDSKMKLLTCRYL